MNWLTHFGTTALPQYDVQFPNGPAPVVTASVALVGGGTFDGYGTGIARQRYPVNLRYQCSVVGPAQATALANMNALKALLGVRAKLWRTEAGALVPGRQWAWARLTDIDDSMRARMPWWIVPVTLNFSLLGRWNGLRHQRPWYFDAGEYFDTGLAFDSDELTTLTTAASAPQTIVVDNDGNLAVRDAIITLVAKTAPITAVTIGVTSVTEFTWAGSVAVGNALVIDVAAKRITNNGVDAYAGFNTTAGHLVADWLVLEPGNNSVIVETDGGGTDSTIEFEFYDGWV